MQQIIDFLILGPVLWLWLLVGYIFLHRGPVIVRHIWGVLGAAGAGVALFLIHRIDPYLYIPVGGFVSGVGCTMLLYGGDTLWGIWKVARAEGGISRARIRALLRRRSGRI